MWERIAYLELLLKYIDDCRAANVSHDLVAAGLAGINKRAANLVRVCRSDATRHRLMKLLADTAAMSGSDSGPELLFDDHHD